MGYFRHSIAVVVINGTDYDEVTRQFVPSAAAKAIEEWRAGVPEKYRHLIVGPTKMVNGYLSYAVMPDGSKEGWDHSNDVDELRQQLVDFAGRYENGLIVNFGGDNDHVTVVRPEPEDDVRPEPEDAE